MSLLLNANGEYLTTTLSGTVPAPTDNKLITAWVKWVTGGTLSGFNVALDLGGGADYLRIFTATNRNFNGAHKYGSSSASFSLANAFTDDVWTLIGAYQAGDVAGASPRRLWRDANATAPSNFTAGGTGVTNFATFMIGNGWSLSSSTQWRGNIAEPAVWMPADITEAVAIMAELLTKRPDAVTTASPVWYARLESDDTVTTGASLSATGSVSYDAGDHPDLEGADPPSGNGSMMMLGIG